MSGNRTWLLAACLGIALVLIGTILVSQGPAMTNDSNSNAQLVIDSRFATSVTVPIAPVAEDDFYIMTENTVLIVDAASGVLANDYDENGDTLHALLLSEASYGAMNLYPDGSFEYTPRKDWSGVDSFIYAVSDGSLTDTATVTITVNPAVEFIETNLTYTGQTGGTYSDWAHLEATLTELESGTPIEGKNISFALGAEVYTAITDDDGIAFVDVQISYGASSYWLNVTFEGDDDYAPSFDAVDFTVVGENAHVAYTGYTVVSTTLDAMTLRATITEEDDGYWGDLTRMNVTFAIYRTEAYPSSIDQLLGPFQVERTDVDGVGVVTVEIPTMLEGEYYIEVQVDASYNIYYAPTTSNPELVKVVAPSSEFLTGGGWVHDSDGKGVFAFVVKYHKGFLHGKNLYLYRDGDWIYILKSRLIVGLEIEDDLATFEGVGTMYRFNPHTREFQFIGSGFLFKVIASDIKRSDTFGILIYDENGLVFHQVPESAIRGNIKIHHGKMWMHMHCHGHHRHKKHR